MAKKSINILISTFLDSVGLTKAMAWFEKLKGVVRRVSASLSAPFKTVSKEIAAISGVIKTSVRAIGSGFASLGRNMMNIKAAIDLATQAVHLFLSAISKGVAFERMTVQFKSLIGSMDDARAHMKDLQNLGRTPPFSLEEFAAASRAMLKMSGGVVGFKEDLKVVGDMAAATGNDIGAVGRAFGLTYQVIRDGQDFGRAGQQLYMLGILTKKQVAYFNDLIKSGKSNAEVWEEVRAVFNRYSGAMEDTKNTAGGMVSAVKGELTVAFTELSQKIMEASIPALKELLEWMQKLNSDGTIDEWGYNVVSVLSKVGNAVKAIGDMWHDTLGTVFAFAEGADKAFHDGKWWDIAGQIKAGKEAAIKYYNREETPEEAKRKQTAIERKELSESVEAQEAEKREAKVQEDLARAREEQEREKAVADREAVERAAEIEALREREGIESINRIEEAYKKSIEERAEVEAKANAEAERDVLRLKERNLRRLHNMRMKEIDDEKRKLERQIDDLKKKGAENPIRMAANLDQAGNIQKKHQDAIDEARFQKAKNNLEAKMAKLGITDINDEEQIAKLGRLNNLDQATLERMRLDQAKSKSKDIESEKVRLLDEMNTTMQDISNQLTAVGV